MAAFVRLFIILAIAAGFSTAARAQSGSCAALGDSASLQDGQLYGVDRSGRWTVLPESHLVPATRWPYRMNLIYVAKTDSGQPRSGVIVTKAGRFLGTEPDTNITVKPVRLRRIETAGYNSCGKGSFKGRVTAESFDAYHDRGFQYDRISATDAGSLQQFHTKYTGAGNECSSSTDNATPDSLGTWNWRNNRSQFSYDDRRVKTGLRSQTVAALRIDRVALAAGFDRDPTGSVGIANQLVEIKRYRTEAGGTTCIPLNIQVSGQFFFLRINDLEGRSLVRWERQWQFLR